MHVLRKNPDPSRSTLTCQSQHQGQAADAPLRTLQGFELGRAAALQFLDSFKQPVRAEDREQLLCVARTSLRTKLYSDLADQLTDIVVDAVLTIRRPDEPIDLFMVRLCNVAPCLSLPPSSLLVHPLF